MKSERRGSRHESSQQSSQLPSKQAKKEQPNLILRNKKPSVSNQPKQKKLQKKQKGLLEKPSDIQLSCMRAKSTKRSMLEECSSGRPKSTNNKRMVWQQEQSIEETTESESEFEEESKDKQTAVFGFKNQHISKALNDKPLFGGRRHNSHQRFKINESSSLQEDSLDNYFEQRFKKSQHELLSTKSKLFENECQIENILTDFKKVKSENKVLVQKIKELEMQHFEQRKKTQKYKGIAKKYKGRFETCKGQFEELQHSQQEQLQNLELANHSLSQSLLQKEKENSENLRQIQTYLTKLSGLLKQNPGSNFSQQILKELVDFCTRLLGQDPWANNSVISSDNQSESLPQQHLLSNESHKNYDIDFILSQTTSNEHPRSIQNGLKPRGKKSQDLGKTKQLVQDYERMKYESEQVRKENAQLKERNETLTFLITEEQASKRYDSRQSQQQQFQSLQMHDLQRHDSVSKLNSKLEDKNSYLHGQIEMMKRQMEELSGQTQQLVRERQDFQKQVEEQRAYIESLQSYYVKSNSTHKQGYADSEMSPQSTERAKQGHRQQQQLEKETKKAFRNNMIFLRPSIDETNTNTDTNRSSVSNYPLQQQRQPLKETKLKKNEGNKRTSLSQNHITVPDSYRDQGTARGISEYQVNSNSGSRTKSNIFKRNYIQEFNDDKENQMSQLQKRTFDYSQNFYKERSQENFLANTSPSIFGVTPIQNNMLSETSGDQSQMKKGHSRIPKGNRTQRVANSQASTSSFCINQKAKNLRDEICTLDQEILQLQSNLRNAMKKRDL